MSIKIHGEEVMKQFFVVALVLFSANLFAQAPCYFKITVAGDCVCTSENFTCPEGATGSGLYRKDDGYNAMYPVATELLVWSFSIDNGVFVVDVTNSMLDCQNIILNQGAAPSDPNFMNCEAEGPSSFEFGVYSHSPTEGDVLRYTVTIERLCGCKEFFDQLPSYSYDPADPEVACQCEGDPSDGATDDLGKNQGPETPETPNVGAPEPGIGDPIIPGSGALVTTVGDVQVPGRMMDINFSRTYRGDMEDPGFTRTYYSPATGQKILLATNQGIEERPPQFDYPVQVGHNLPGYKNNVNSTDLQYYNYIFMQVIQSVWTLGNDCTNIHRTDPNDPNDCGLINFDDIDGGTASVETLYCVYGTNDPNGGDVLIYFNQHASGAIHSTFNRSFTYDMNRYTCRLGRKWDHSYNISLDKLYSVSDTEPEEYMLLAGNGKKLLYIQQDDANGDPTEIFLCPSDSGSMLHRSESGLELFQKGGQVWKFNSDLRISEIADINGNKLTFDYNNALLYRVTNDAGNYITFYYDSYNMIDYISDNLGRTWNYNRDANFDLVEVVKPITDDNNQNITNTYTYIAGNLLATATDGAGQNWLENTYSEDGRIVTQRYGDSDYENVYHFGPDGSTDYVDTYDRNGNYERVILTQTGLIRKKSKEIAEDVWADTEYLYDFDIEGRSEMNSKCVVRKIMMPAGDIYQYEYDDYGNRTAVIHKSDAADMGINTQYTYSDNIASLPLSTKDAEGNTTQFTYDTTGNLIKIEMPQITVSDPNNPGTLIDVVPQYHFTYNQYGQVTALTLPDGINVVCTYYNGSGKYWPATITYDYGQMNLTMSYNYDAMGNVISVTDPDGVFTSYVYDNASRIKTVINALNAKTVIHYNKSGLIDNAYYQLGGTFDLNNAISTTFEYTSVDRLKKITDSLGRITEFGFDNNDNLISAADPLARTNGYSTVYGYNAQDLLASIALPQDYDTAEGNQNVTTFTYTVDGLVQTATDAMGQITSYYYDGYRRLSGVLYPDGTTQFYGYDKRGYLISETKRDGSIIYYNYDALGRLINRGSQSIGGVVARNSQLTDFLKTGLWDAEIDEDCISGRYVASNDPTASYTLFGFGSQIGRYAVAVRYVSFGVASNPNVKIECYDEVSGIVSTQIVNQQAGGDTWVYLGMMDFKAMPRVFFKANGDSRLTTVDAIMLIPAMTYDYDINSRLIKAKECEFAYDRAGRLISSKDGFARVLSYEYTPGGRRSKMTWPDGYFVTYGYDIAGRICGINDNNNQLLWSCIYDAADRRIQTTDYYGVTTTYDYEDAGSANDNRGIYLKGLAVSLNSTDNLSFAYNRDDAGNITGIVRSWNSLIANLSYVYDNNYSLTSVVFETVQTQYDYDNLSNRKAVTSGTVIAPVTMSSISSGDTLTLYSASLDSVSTAAVSDTLAVTSADTTATSTKSAIGLGRHKKDRHHSTRDEVTTSTASTASTALTTSSTPLLATASTPIVTINSMSSGDTVVLYTASAADASRYLTAGSANIAYDQNGNMITYGTAHYLYNSENQMIAYYKLDGDPNETMVSFYGYDVFGRRTSRAVALGINNAGGGIIESYMYDGEQIVGEYAIDTLHIKRRFIYGPGIDEPIAMIVQPDHQGYYGYKEFSDIADSWLCQTSDACFNAACDYVNDGVINFDDIAAFLSDHYTYDRPLLGTPKIYGYSFDGMGNVVGLTFRNDPNETLNPVELPYFVETYNYDPFGMPTIYDSFGTIKAQSAVENPYMFTGRQYDDESGLYYYRMRMYSPELGRFIQTDPIGYYDSMNLYQYCGNNPVNYVDPWGLSREGDAAADWARRQKNNPDYGARAREPMEHKFIRDAFRESGAPYPRRWWNRDSGWPLYPSLQPPSANEMGNPDYNMPGFPLVKPSGKKLGVDDLQPGDILSFRSGGSHQRGHSAIYVGGGKMTQASITFPGAHTTIINDKLWDMIRSGRGTVRRYTPNQ